MSDWKFKEYSLYNKSQIWYRLRTLLSYNLPINIIIGARGTGKTFSIKEHIIKDFINNPAHNFCWIRDNVDDIKKLAESNGRKWKEDIPLMNLPISTINITNSVIKINDTIAGDLMPVSTYQRYKGNSYQECYNMMFDEFIPEKGRVKKSTVEAIVNTFNTVLRTRKQGRIFMTANALDKGDPFLDFLGVQLKDFGFYVNRKMGVVIHYADNSAKFNNVNSEGIVGKLILNSPKHAIKDNMMDGKFLNDDESLFFDKLPSKSTMRFILETPLQRARFYYNNGKLWVTADYDINTYVNKRYVVNIEDCSFCKPVFPQYTKKMLKEYIVANKVMYQSAFLKSFILSII